MFASLKNQEFSIPASAYPDLLSGYPLPTWIISAKTLQVLFANKAVTDLFGFNVDAIPAISFLDLFQEKSRVLFFQHISSGQKSFNGTFAQFNTNQQQVITEIHATSLIIQGALHYQVTAVDITHRVQLQHQLEEEGNRYKTYVEQSFEGIFCQEMRIPLPVNQSHEALIEQARNSYISECNDAMAKMYGYNTASELKGVLTEQLMDFSDPANLEYFKYFIDNGFKVINAESHEKDRHGKPINILNNIIGIVEDGFLKRIWGTQKDITIQKKIEEEFRLLALLVEQTSDVLTAADIEFRPTTWNKAAENVYGLKHEEVIGKDLSQLINFQYLNFTRNEIRDIVATDGEWRGEVSFIRPKDQKCVTLLMGFKLLRDQNDQALGYLISGTDITERKEAESRLRESEYRFREMADSAPAMIWMTDENNLTTYINKEWLKFTGKDIIGVPDGWTFLVHKDDVDKTIKEYKRAFKLKQQVSLHYRLLKYDGSYRWVYDVSVPRFLNNGNFIGYIGSVIDIEDQKNKQEQLLYQSTILENVSDIIITTDLDFRIKVLNRVAEKYYDVSEEDVIGKKMSDVVQFNYNGTTHEKALVELKKQGIWKGEVFIVNKNGEKLYFLNTVKYVADENDNRIGFLSTARDITDRKLADEKLESSEQFYRTLIADSLDGILLLDADGKITFASPSLKNVLGFEVNDVLGRNGFEFVHPDDIKWAFESFQKEVVEKPEIKFITVRLLKKSGEWLWCMVRGHNLLNNPSINSLVIYFHNDSLRKEASDALKESEKQFRNLIRDIQLGVVMQDNEGRTLLCNDAFAEMFASTKEQLLGLPIQAIAFDPIHEDGRQFLQEERPTWKAIHTKQAARDVVMGVMRANISHRAWLLINADPVLDEHGEILHIICCVKDITEWKKMEEDQKIKQLQHQRQLTQASIDGQEKERIEIGKELHDNIGQQLTTIKLFLDIAKTTADEQTHEMLSMSLKGVSDVINEVRELSRSLVPSTLKDLGLIESINELVDSMARTQLLDVHFSYADFDEDLLEENQKLTFFRIVQEQLNNIVKHAEAENTWIDLKSNQKNIMLQVKDDGIGFNLKKIRKGLGFMNIKNRAELFNGRADITSKPGEGCELRVSIPKSEGN